MTQPQTRWHTFTPEDHATLRFTLGGQVVEATVIEMSKSRCRIQPARGILDHLQPSMVLRSLVFTRGELVHELPELIVSGLYVDEAWTPNLWLKASSKEAEAALWIVLEKLAQRTDEFDEYTREQLRNLPRVPARGLYTEDARQERLQFLRDHANHNLKHTQHTELVAEKLTGNIENLIGGIEVPLGLAGPLLFRGDKARDVFYLPMATSEGALVASATRGATAITRAGGVNTRVIQQRMMRVPLFVLSDMHGAFRFANWIRDHVDDIRAQVGKVSRHAKLVNIEPRLLGNQVHVEFLYETGDAAGQNMTTSCTWFCCQWLMQQMEHYDEIVFDNFIVEANMSGDKKVNYHSFIMGRGTRVTAECLLPDDVIESVLKVKPDQLMSSFQMVNAGSAQVGMVGFNINVANIIAAVFTATGQDIASVHESSLAQLFMQRVKGGIYVSIMLPALIIGTVGGGTALPRQREMLETLGCYGPGKVSRFAEIIAGFCLALDLSTLSAIASGQFATAHDRLGRNRPVEWFTARDLSAPFFEAMLKTYFDDEGLSMQGQELLVRHEKGSSIITEMTARKVSKLVGHFPYRLDYQADGDTESREVMVKVKPLGDEVGLMINSMAGMCNQMLAQAYSKFQDRTGFAFTHVKELGVYNIDDEVFKRYLPAIYGTYQNAEREAYVVVMERLSDMVLMDTADDTSAWTRVHIEAAIDGAAQLHAVHYEDYDAILNSDWIGTPHTLESMVEMRPLWESLGVHAAEEFPEWVNQRDLGLIRELVRDIPLWWVEIERMPRTLIHNDFNPRNICLRKKAGGYELCAYDWELATIQLPQHDIAELLCFVLTPQTTEETLFHYVDYHRRALEVATGKSIDKEEWVRGFLLSLYDLCVNRLGLYVMAHTFRHYAFMERVVRTLRHLIYMLRTDLEQ